MKTRYLTCKTCWQQLNYRNRSNEDPNQCKCCREDFEDDQAIRQMLPWLPLMIISIPILGAIILVLEFIGKLGRLRSDWNAD